MGEEGKLRGVGWMLEARMYGETEGYRRERDGERGRKGKTYVDR